MSKKDEDSMENVGKNKDENDKDDNGPVKSKEERIAARNLFRANMAAATTGIELVNHNQEYGLTEKGQAAFAFNRAKKILQHYNIITGDKWKKGFGAMGKAMKAEYFAFFSLINTADVLNACKEAMLFDSKNEEGDTTTTPASEVPPLMKSEKKKRRREGEVESMANAASHAGLPPVMQIPSVTPNSSPEEVEEIVRTIKSIKLANAIHHPSYQLLDEHSKEVIKNAWLETLLGVQQVSGGEEVHV